MNDKGKKAIQKAMSILEQLPLKNDPFIDQTSPGFIISLISLYIQEIKQSDENEHLQIKNEIKELIKQCKPYIQNNPKEFQRFLKDLSQQ